MAVLVSTALFGVALGLLLFTRPIYPQFACTLDTTASFVATCYLASLVASGLRWLLPKDRVSSLNKAVFVTGCDTGFGHETAKRLDTEGFHVFAGCLKPEEEGALKLKSSCSSRLHIVPLDVTSDESVSNAFQFVTKHLGNQEFWAVVNNAGIGYVGELEVVSLDQYKSVFEVNTWGVVRVTQAFLPLLRRSKGRVVTVTSLSAQISSPGVGIYTMSKFATRAFCEVLLMEMKKWGVNVSMIEPSAYRTNLYTKENMEQFFDTNWNKASAQVRSDYGSEYFEAFKHECSKQDSFEFLQSSKLSLVVDCIYDAMTSTEPKLYYRPCALYMKLLLWSRMLLPEGTLNSLFSLLVWLVTRNIKPSMLQKETEKKGKCE